MRPLARYALTAKVGDTGIPADIEALSSSIDAWLVGKGWTDRRQPQFLMLDGRQASVERFGTSSGSGRIERWILREPINDGRTEFSTHISICFSNIEVAIYCELGAINVHNALAPQFVDVRCPSIIRNLIGQGSEWHYARARVAASALPARGSEQGQYLVNLLQDTARPLPVVVVSSHMGLTLQNDIAASIARDVVGLATVVQVDDEAAWKLTQILGREWSCYQGAIRLYWPLPIPSGNPLQHSLWTASRLLTTATSVEEAAERLRNFLRRKLMGVSVFSVLRPVLFDVIERESAVEQRESDLARARSNNTWEQLALTSTARCEELENVNSQLKGENDALRERMYLMQAAAAYADVEPDDLLPDSEPETLEQAVTQARLELATTVTFGKDVDEGVESLDPKAGPPNEVLRYLRTLGLMAEELRAGQLGNSYIGWLKDMGVKCNGESETDRNNAATMKRRQWNDGAKIRQFELHLKPADGVPPHLCARIYFDWDQPSQQIVVGWVGRHPD